MCWRGAAALPFRGPGSRCAGRHHVFVPADVAHAYSAVEPTRYLVILTPRRDALFDDLQRRKRSTDLATTLVASTRC